MNTALNTVILMSSRYEYTYNHAHERTGPQSNDAHVKRLRFIPNNLDTIAVTSNWKSYMMLISVSM